MDRNFCPGPILWARPAAVLSLALLVLVFSPLSADAVAQDVPGQRVTVVMTELAPFVVDNGGEADGFYAEIWDEVANTLGVDYDVLWVDSFGELLPAIADGRAEVAIAPLAPTAVREAKFDFTSAVVRSGPQLGYSDRLSVRPSVLRSLVDVRVLRLVAFAILGLVAVGHVMWLAERNRHDRDGDFHKSYFRGVWDGLWWSTVTATTVGYGDKAPRSFSGRLVGLIVMLASLVLVGAFVSQVTSIMAEDLSRAPVESLQDVDGPVGAVLDSTFASFVSAEGGEVRGYESQSAVFEALAAGEVDVIVANPFALQALGASYGVTAIGDVLYEEFETFGLAQDSPWREPINQVLADLQASGEVAEIVKDGLN